MYRAVPTPILLDEWVHQGINKLSVVSPTRSQTCTDGMVVADFMVREKS